MSKSYFFSDAHLGLNHLQSEKSKIEKILSFFKHVGETGDRLFIVGDLFDFWFEYRTVIPRGQTKIISSLIQLKELGKEIHYIAGNHDFWMKDFFSKELDIPVHFNSLEYKMNGKQFFIQHGDGISQKDVGYRIIKRIFRNRFNIFLYSLLHPDLGIPLAQWISTRSRKHTGEKGPPDDSDYQQLATVKFNEGFDYVMFAHLHFPIFKEIDEKVYINLGDWIEHFSYAVFDGKELQLLKWE